MKPREGTTVMRTPLRTGLIGIAVALWFVSPAAPASAQQTRAEQPNTPGRVVATITTLDGTVHMPGVQVELRRRVRSDRPRHDGTDAGLVTFPDVPPGRYIVNATRPGFVSTNSATFDVRAARSTKVLLDIQLTFVMPEIEVRAETPSPTDSVQPVSMSDMLSGSVLEIAPLEGDDFQSLLLLLPGVVRGPDGRLRIKGGQPSQGALQVSSASLIDPSTGDFDLDLPGQSVESVEVLANPFAAEYGRFSTSVTQIRTRRGTNDWEIKPGNLMPRFRKSFSGVRGFEPRFSIRGPLKHDRAFIAQDFQFRYVATPVKSLPDEPEIELKSFDSFTRVDTVVSARHTLGGGLIVFPREIKRATMSTFRPPEVTPDFNQSGLSTGVVDRLALAPRRRPRNHACRAGGSRSTSTPTAGRRWCTRRRPRAAASSTIRSAKSAACNGSRRSASRATGAASTSSRSAPTCSGRSSPASAPAGRSRSGASTARSRS